MRLGGNDDTAKLQKSDLRAINRVASRQDNGRLEIVLDVYIRRAKPVEGGANLPQRNPYLVLWLRANTTATSFHSSRHSFCSSAGRVSSDRDSRSPARSGFTCQCHNSFLT